MKKARELYDNEGKKRMYREDEEGRTFIYWKDNKEKLIIRDFFEDDALAWYNAMMAKLKLSAKQKMQCIEKVKKMVRNRSDDDLEFCLLVTTISGKVIGTIDVYPTKEHPGFDVEVTLALRNEEEIKQKGENLIRAVWNLHENYNWYDEIYIRGENGKASKLYLEAV